MQIPEQLQTRKRWVLWRVEDGDRKVPYSIRGRRASSTKESTWATYQEVVNVWTDDPEGYAGLGFILGDGICGVDLDDCRDPKTGVVADWATEIIKLCDSYAEVSPSGTGVKIFCLGDVPQAYKRKREDGDGAIEVYASGRFFTVTGRAL